MKKHPIRLLTTEQDDSMDSTRVRGMDEVAHEARTREETATRGGRVADACMFREIAERAEHVAKRERNLGRTLTGDEALKERQRLQHQAWMQRGIVTFGMMMAGIALAIALSSCSSLPRIGPDNGTIEAYTGMSTPTSRGKNDVADIGPYSIVGVSGAIAQGDQLTDAAGEFFIEGGSAVGEVDTAELGIFDLDAEVIRAGLGLRLGTHRALGLDWTLGLGACLTIVHGEASAGPALTADVDESGLGFYSAGTVSRGLFFLRTTYVSGPEVEVQGEGVELGGLSVVGGLRWSF